MCLALLPATVKASQYERAAALAEKYFDFGSLVEICDATSNQDRLQSYMSQFAEQVRRPFPTFASEIVRNSLPRQFLFCAALSRPV